MHLVRSRTRLLALGFMRCRIRGGGVAASVVVDRRLVVSDHTVRPGLPLVPRQDARGLGLVVHDAASFPFERTLDTNVAAMGRVARKVIEDVGIDAAGGCDVIARRPEGEFSGPRQRLRDLALPSSGGDQVPSCSQAPQAAAAPAGKHA